VKSRKSKFLSAFAAAFLFLTLVPAFSSAADSVPDEQYSTPNEPGPGYFGFNSFPDFQLHANTGHLLGMQTTGVTVNKVVACNSLADPKCAGSNFWKFRAVLPMCQSAADTNCIDEVIARDKDNVLLPVNSTRKFPTVREQDYTGDPAQNLPNGSQLPLVDIPGAPHAGGTLYIPMILIDGEKENDASSGKFYPGIIQMGLYAVSIKNGSFGFGNYASTDSKRYVDRGWMVSGGQSNPECIVQDATQCALAQRLPLNVSFGFKIRTTFSLPGWFHGRVINPEIQVSKDSGGNSLFSISATPVVSPIVSVWKKKTELPESLNSFINKLQKPLGGSGSGAGDMAVQSGSPDSWSLMFDTVAYENFQMEQFLEWLPVIGDKATKDPTYWSFRGEQGNVANSKCPESPNELNGIVSTNATQYIAGPPKWNEAEQSLDYKVAAAHYKANGEEFKGSYNLAIKSELARCLYDFTKAPIKATISIVSRDGSQQVATTIVNEKDGWLYLSANGFTFSNPILKVKLMQDAPTPVVTPTPTASPTPTPVVTIKPVPIQKIIVCVKGKTIKKVKAVSPKCPSGYKKK